MAVKTYGLDKKQIALCDAMIAKYPKGIKTNNVVSSDAIWQNTNEAYDVAIGGQPFFYAMNDQRPYVQQTAPL